MEFRKAGKKAIVGRVMDEYEQKYSEETVPYGAGVMRGTDPADQCKLMTAGGKFIGVAMFRNKAFQDKFEYSKEQTIEVMIRGYVFVTVAENVVAGDKASCGAGGKFGKVGTAGYDTINGEYETSAAAGEFAILRLI